MKMPYFIICKDFTLLVICVLKFTLLSDIGIGQSQDDSIVGLRQTKHIPAALPVSGTLSSSNPDLLQSHHRILDFSTTPGEHQSHPAFSVTSLSNAVVTQCACLAWLDSIIHQDPE